MSRCGSGWRSEGRRLACARRFFCALRKKRGECFVVGCGASLTCFSPYRVLQARTFLLARMKRVLSGDGLCVLVVGSFFK